MSIARLVALDRTASRTIRWALFISFLGLGHALAAVPVPDSKPSSELQVKTGGETAQFSTVASPVPIPSVKPLRGTPPALPDKTELPARHRLLSSTDREIGKKAMKESSARHFDAARRIASHAKDPLVGELIRWLWLQTPSSGASFAEIASFIESKPDWPARDALLRRADENIDASAGDKRIIAWFVDHPPQSGLGMLRYGEALSRQGRDTEAFTVLRRAWVEGNLALRDEKALWSEFGNRFTDADNAARVDRLLWDGNIDAARRMLPRLSPDYRKMAEARIALAKNANGADKLIAAVPQDLRDDGGLAYDRLRWQRRHDMDDVVEAMLYNAPDDLGRAEKWWVERRFRARKAMTEGRISEAYRLAAGHGLKGGAAYAEAEWLAGWIALRLLQEPQTALKHFTNLSNNVSYPISVARAAYWLGRTYTALGSPEDAKLWYAQAAKHSTTFYGQLAAEVLDASQPLQLPPETHPTAEDRQRFEKREVVRAARILMELDEEDRLRPFILRLVHTAKTAEDHKLVAQFARELRRVDLSVMASKRSARQNIILVRESYPLVDPMLRVNTPETALVLSVARQESEFNQLAVSSAGARGLMQLMPVTAKHLSKDLKLGFHEAKLTSNAGYNVQLGSHYLKRLLDNWGNNYVLALAAYNAGENRVRRWIQDWGDPRNPSVDVIDWIELIPFSETRNYVQRVLESVQVYRSLLGREPAPINRLYVDLKGSSQQACSAGC